MDSSSGHSPSLRHIVEEAAHLLPAQGPIGVFIHHNTLHAFQHLPFEEAVQCAAEVYGNEPYLKEADYLEALKTGRIRKEDIGAVLWNELEATAWPGMRRSRLRQSLLVAGVREYQPETVTWALEQEGWLDGEETRSLFQACLRQVPLPEEPAAEPIRPRDGIHALTGVDIDDAVNSWLIRLCGAFLDQGVAYWPMPDRDRGFLHASLSLLSASFSPLHAVFASLPKRCREFASLDAEAVLRQTLSQLGVELDASARVIQAELLALPGWAGMMHRLECEPELAPHEVIPARLMDFLAVRMLLTLSAVESQLTDLTGWKRGYAEPADTFHIRLAKTATLFDAARKLEVSFAHLPALHQELNAFPEIERRRILHLAYERRHEREILVPLQKHLRKPASKLQSHKLNAQVFFCIDEREESIRRHLEEIAPEIETFGAAGFFGVAMNYQGMDDAHGVSLCPVVVKPQHAITERPAGGHWGTYARRTRLRRLWAWAARHWWVSSKTAVRGWVGTLVLGTFSVVPLAARVLSPRRYARTIEWLNASILPEPRTELAFERKETPGQGETFELLKGFSVEEKVDRVASVLGNAGLRRGMARLVVVLGHGSTSLNNPHESAHDCGACGGRRGGPNGRIFAAMANHPEVRTGLRARGITILDDTWFVGGYHDTCNDVVDLYDLEAVPQSHRRELSEVRATLDRARAASANERARRFEAADWPRTDQKGLHHVEERAEHLAEPRPEYGHCTNAVCFVGGRASTRGLFLDRRAFLVSYDPAQDASGQGLAAVLGAVVPVCGGISLEYYFSSIDNERYGCGTKLPHNVTGLVGVMNGFESDLRTGLPLQMVEIHEPVRILFVIENTPERIEQTFRNSPLLWEFLSNRWIRLAALDAATGNIDVYRDGQWEPMEGGDEKLGKAKSSRAWYEGRMEHLGMARIEAEVA